MLKMMIQMFNDDEQGGQPSTPFKAFATEDDFKKFEQSTRSKAQGELLKEIGIANVAEAKDGLAKIKGYVELETNYKNLEGNYTTLKGEHENLSNELIVTKYQVPDDFKTEFLTLAKAGVTEKVTIAQSAEIVAKKFNSVLGGKGKVIIGGASGGTKTPEEEQIAKVRQAMGLK
jgi:hypothetical protein